MCYSLIERLGDRDDFVCFNARELLNDTAGPTDDHLVDMLPVANPEMQARVVLGQIARPRSPLLHQCQVAGPHGDPGPYTVAIAPGASQLDDQPMVLVAAVIAQQDRRLVQVHDENIQVAIVVVVSHRHAPGDALVTEKLSRLAYERKQQYPEAIDALKKAARLADTNPSSLGYLGNVYAAAGKKAEAQKVLEELKELSKQRYVSPFYTACVYAGLNDKDLAFEWLERAYQERSFFMAILKTETSLDNLRPDPRFKDLLKRMNLPE